MAQLTKCVEVEARHPLYPLYTSGITGNPKGILRNHGSYAVALSFSMEYIYDMQPEGTF
ncbi:MAG: AMP-binding protein [Flavobacteriales bacterium AspAUS03]